MTTVLKHDIGNPTLDKVSDSNSTPETIILDRSNVASNTSLDNQEQEHEDINILLNKLIWDLGCQHCCTLTESSTRKCEHCPLSINNKIDFVKMRDILGIQNCKKIFNDIVMDDYGRFYLGLKGVYDDVIDELGKLECVKIDNEIIDMVKQNAILNMSAEAVHLDLDNWKKTVPEYISSIDNSTDRISPKSKYMDIPIESLELVSETIDSIEGVEVEQDQEATHILEAIALSMCDQTTEELLPADPDILEAIKLSLEPQPDTIVTIEASKIDESDSKQEVAEQNKDVVKEFMSSDTVSETKTLTEEELHTIFGLEKKEVKPDMTEEEIIKMENTVISSIESIFVDMLTFDKLIWNENTLNFKQMELNEGKENTRKILKSIMSVEFGWIYFAARSVLIDVRNYLVYQI